MKNIIIPKIYVEDPYPLIFLNGPVRGVKDWRNDKGIEYIQKKDSDIYIAVPTPTNKEVYSELIGDSPNERKSSPRDYIKPSLREFIAEGHELMDTYNEWKEHYMIEAVEHGTLLFWIPQEKKNDHTYTEYGLRTAEEIEYWTNEIKKDLRNKKRTNINISVGIEGTFKMWNHEDHEEIFAGTGIHIHHNLEDTLKEAIDKCKYYK